MRVRSLSMMILFVAAVMFTIGCSKSENPSSPKPETTSSGDDPNPDVGSALYKAKPDIKFPPSRLTGMEPLVVPSCQAMYEDKQQVAAEVDGTIDLIAVNDDTIKLNDPDLVFHPRDPERKVKYRRLRDGYNVKAGQLLCMLDEQLVNAKLESARGSKLSALEVKESAKEGVKLSEEKLALSQKTVREGSGSRGEVLQDQITLTRFVENLSNANLTIVKAEGEEKEANVMLRKHQIRSRVNGVIRNITRRPGEFVKAGEKIMEIQATDLIRLEGNLEIQYAGFVRPGMMVTVEPAVPSPPDKTLALHRAAVTGVSVSSHPDRPLVVSAGADGSARVWDVTGTANAFNLPHPVGVRSVACSPHGVKAVVAVTGGDDGKVRVWDITNPDKLSTEPKVLADDHAAAIGAIAFSPDGRFLATAAGRDVFIWDAVEWKKLYALPAEHRDTVTYLQFTPQGTLVTASKDRSLKIWKLGTEKAAVTRTLDHRSGAVDVLGVTADGGRVVFDQSKTRLDLVGLADRQTTGSVQNVGPTAAFASLAVFNRDDTLLLTAGGDGELKGGLQVWKVPEGGGRGAEAARLFTPARVGVTTAAFSPSEKHHFLVVGTEIGTVHLWVPPSPSHKAYTGKVMYVNSTDPRYLTVRVEMDNRELNMLDQSTATVIINPGQ